MKKRVLSAAALMLVCAGAFTQSVFAQQPTPQAGDSVRLINMQTVHVISTRANDKTPMPHTDLSGREIARVNYGQDVPFLLLTTPSVVATSDAGAGVGYTGIRIRGTDATRINVTANGIPMNDGESHSLFWVNTPDLISSVNDVQIQRGVGTSTNGAGAFGGSVNLTTEPLTVHPSAMFSGSYGSFNTHKETVKVNSGLIGGRWGFGARLSNIASDGYVDRAWTRMKSYFAQAGYYHRGTLVRLLVFGGEEQTYHAWTGVTRAQMDDPAYGRRYNPCGEVLSVVRDGDGRPVFDQWGAPETYVSGFYNDQTDNYKQTNFQLLVTQQLAPSLSLSVNFHYTPGEGYYEEYKNAGKLVEYDLKPFVPGDPAYEAYMSGGLVSKSNLVRRKEMENWFGGGVFSLNYASARLKASLGGAANRYDGDHFGRVAWIQNYAADPSFQPGHEYYRNRGVKDDANVYLRANWQAFRKIYLYGDVQYRHINYRIDGTNDNWDNTIGAMQPLAVNERYDFFNPKAGVYYDASERMKVYASVAVAHKEPTRNDFTDAESDAAPKPERLVDWEAGASYCGRVFSLGANLYYMKYKDQLVLTGEVNHIGEPLAANVPDSYRAGIELIASAQLTRWLRWDVNATLSRNRIRGYTENIPYYDDSWEQDGHISRYLGSTEISFSPSVLAGSLLTATWGGLTASLQSNYVGRQYVTNSASALTAAETATEKLTLDAYFVNNLRVDYTFAVRSLNLDNVTVGVAVNNIFDEQYCNNGYGWSSYQGATKQSAARINEMYYFPQAGTNVLASVTLRF